MFFTAYTAYEKDIYLQSYVILEIPLLFQIRKFQILITKSKTKKPEELVVCSDSSA